MGTNISYKNDLLQVADWENPKNKEGISTKSSIRRYLNLPLKMESKDYFYEDIKDNEDICQWNSANKYIALVSKNSNKGLVYLNDGHFIRISSQLSQLIESIGKSRYILDLKDNWDEEGSKAYSKDTWTKAVKFIVYYAEWVLTNHGKSIITPQIYHGPDGSIDLYWKNTSFNLLINVPEEDESLSTFYGDNYDGQKVEGSFNPEKLLPSLFPSLINLI